MGIPATELPHLNQAVNCLQQQYTHQIARGIWTVTIPFLKPGSDQMDKWESDSFNNPTVGSLMDALDQWIETSGDHHVFLENYRVLHAEGTIELGVGS